MKGAWSKVAVSAFCTVITVTGCSTVKQNNHTQPIKIQSDTAQMNNNNNHKQHLNSIKVIPRYDGEKIHTTNKNGTTYSGMGQGIYSRIGTSSLHDTGESKTLETRFEAAGLSGLEVLEQGGSVYIGDTGKHTHLKNSKPQPYKVLNPNQGLSGKGYLSSQGTGATIGQKSIDETNMNVIHQEVERIYGKKMKIYTVHDPEAVKAIERVKTAIRNGSTAGELDNDLATIRKHAHLEKKQ